MEGVLYEVEIISYTSEEGGSAFGISWGGLPSYFSYYASAQPAGFCTKAVAHQNQVIEWKERFQTSAEFTTFAVGAICANGPSGSITLSEYLGKGHSVDLPLLLVGKKAGILKMVVNTNVCKSCRTAQKTWCDVCDVCEETDDGSTSTGRARRDSGGSCSSHDGQCIWHQPCMDPEEYYELEFRRSLTNTYPSLHFEIISITAQPVQPEQQARLTAFAEALPASCSAGEKSRRHVYHSANASVVAQIANLGLRPSYCDMCLGRAPYCDHDDGWFGNHSKGVYVSKHADYTMFYNKMAKPVGGDEGTLIMFQTIIGRSKKFKETDNGCAPSEHHDCHVSPNTLEYFLYDADTLCEPPKPCLRLIPVAVIKWRAVTATRSNIPHDQ